MKVIKWILITLVAIIILALVTGYFWLRSTSPQYNGNIQIKGLEKKVEIIFDDYGVPHIYAHNAHDAYLALGYVQAQERLFQMEMIRRVTSGRLSELLGEKFLDTDKTMLTLSIRNMAERSAEKYFKEIDAPYKKETLAYLKGINSFIENGTLPIEFRLLGFEPEPFEPVDVYTAIGYMSLSFTSALSQEPLVTEIMKNLGQEYLKDFGLDSLSHKKQYQNKSGNVSQRISNTIDNLIIPVWYGSNNWVLSADRSKSGKVLLANDTHIRYSQPAVWYEAYVEYPGFSMGGYYLATVPYAIIGHNNLLAWSTTIFPFDNMDLYQEKQNPNNADQVWVDDRWEDYEKDISEIPVKGKEPVIFEINKTRHGPVINDIYKNIATGDDPPISLWWALNDVESTVMEALYLINNSKNITEFENAMKYIDLIGMNMVYGDAEGNIALWSAGQIPIRPEHVNSKLILDGASGKDEILGYYPFDKNPKIVNPDNGFITTSNDEPIRVDGIMYPGYYTTGIRADRIKKLINTKDKWSLEEMKQVQLDNVSERDTMIVNILLRDADIEKIRRKGPAYQMALKQLKDWDGSSGINSIGATIFNNVIYFVIYNTVTDEMEEGNSERLIGSFLVRSRMGSIISNNHSPWFDKINTESVETRKEIFTTSIDEGISSMINQFGEDVSQWKWGKVHTLTHVHPIGREEPLDKVFNVGPFAKSGSNDVIDKEGFKYNSSGFFPVKDGPAMRMLVDFANPYQIQSILPTGQSGNIMSPHYSDQAQMFNTGRYRTFNKKRSNIEQSGMLILEP